MDCFTVEGAVLKTAPADDLPEGSCETYTDAALFVERFAGQMAPADDPGTEAVTSAGS